MLCLAMFQYHQINVVKTIDSLFQNNYYSDYTAHSVTSPGDTIHPKCACPT